LTRFWRKIGAIERPSVCNDGVVAIGWARCRMWGVVEMRSVYKR